MKTFTKITEVNSRGRKFFIIKDSNGYWGIESNLFVDGVLSKQINGIQGNLSKTAEECINAVLYRIEFDYLKDTGMDVITALAEAAKVVYKA